MFRTHLVLGFLTGLIFVTYVNIPYPLIFVLLVALFSGLPDIDHPKSTYGRKLWFLSIPISLISKHRGIFHSIFPPLIAFFVLSNSDFAFIGLAVLVGYLSHLLGDALTKQGINFLHPISRFEIRGPLTTGAMFEALIFYVILALDIFYTMKIVGF